MKRMVLICLGFCVISATVKADFSGEWRGPGKATVNNGITVNCREIAMKMAQTPNELIEEDGYALCALRREDFEDTKFEIRNRTDLYLDNKKVGALTEKTVKAKYTQKGTTIALDVAKIDDKTVSFIADVDRNGNHYHVVGKLKKQIE